MSPVALPSEELAACWLIATGPRLRSVSSTEQGLGSTYAPRGLLCPDLV